MKAVQFFLLFFFVCSTTAFSQPADTIQTRKTENSIQLNFLPVPGVGYTRNLSPGFALTAGTGYAKAILWRLLAKESATFSCWVDGAFRVQKHKNSHIYLGPFLAYRYQYAVVPPSLFRILSPFLGNSPAHDTEIKRAILSPGFLGGIRTSEQNRIFGEAQLGFGYNVFLRGRQRAVNCGNPEDCALIEPYPEDLRAVHIRILVALGYRF